MFNGLVKYTKTAQRYITESTGIDLALKPVFIRMDKIGSNYVAEHVVSGAIIHSVVPDWAVRVAQQVTIEHIEEGEFYAV